MGSLAGAYSKQSLAQGCGVEQGLSVEGRPHAGLMKRSLCGSAVTPRVLTASSASHMEPGDGVRGKGTPDAAVVVTATVSFGVTGY
ncbi:hypothetical protein BKA03_002767 [Demequina lutea]|uniref:Uncharacterized protein n=1 Tax=Demequina lutea TaxID=431489 RepID=A0A7Y9ZDL9_9MICO|nr:hypothetical protein [Demequina lutea]